MCHGVLAKWHHLSALWGALSAKREQVTARERHVSATWRMVLAKWHAFPGKWRAFPGKVWKVASTWKSFQGVGNSVSRAKEPQFRVVKIVSRRAANVSRW